MRMIRTFMIIVLAMVTGMLCGCFPKGYTSAEEKDQLAHAVALARIYQEKYAPSARIKENTFHVYDAMREGEHELKLTDWVCGEYLDGGEYNMYINTGTNEIYSDKEWTSVVIFGRKLAEKLYDLDEDEMTVDVWGSTELPFREDDPAFGMLTLSNMLPATDTVDESYLNKLLENDDYHFTYHIDVKKDVDMDMFKTLDTQPLGKNVSISIRQYSDEAFSDRKYHPEKRNIADKQAEPKQDENVSGDAKMLELLYGDWEIMDDGELIQEPGMKRDRLRFSLPKDHRVKFITAGGDEESFDIELSDVFEDPGKSYDRLILSNRAGSGKFNWDEVRPEQSFQIMIANNLGHDYMMLRELGDERTGFATDGLKYDRSILGTWMLRRPDPNAYDNEIDEMQTTPSTVGIEDEIRQKGTSFHAIKWMEFGNSCTLQRVEVIPTTVELVGGGPYDALEYCLPDDEYAYSAVNYEYKGKENMAHGGYFAPALVYVTTDQEGQIIEMSSLNYALNGAYYDTGEMVFPR